MLGLIELDLPSPARVALSVISAGLDWHLSAAWLAPLDMDCDVALVCFCVVFDRSLGPLLRMNKSKLHTLHF